MGDVIGDINSRRGMINELVDKRGTIKLVKAKVPLSEMFQYVSSLRSLTKGRASYSMELETYEQVPSMIEKELAAKFNGGGEEEE
jgi:elongation factor G